MFSKGLIEWIQYDERTTFLLDTDDENNIKYIVVYRYKMCQDESFEILANLSIPYYQKWWDENRLQHDMVEKKYNGAYLIFRLDHEPLRYELHNLYCSSFTQDKDNPYDWKYRLDNVQWNKRDE